MVMAVMVQANAHEVKVSCADFTCQSSIAIPISAAAKFHLTRPDRASALFDHSAAIV
jgi:hypothetical protein